MVPFAVVHDRVQTTRRFSAVKQEDQREDPLGYPVEQAAMQQLDAGVEKWRGHTYVPFEGSYGFGRDGITTGWLKTSLRALDERASRPFDPVPTFSHPQPLAPGQVVPVDIALGPSATLFKAGEALRLIVAGRWLWPLNPLTGQFPAAYAKGPKGTCTLHWGPRHQARLLVPVIS